MAQEEVPSKRIPLSMAQGDLIERLFAKLSDHLNPADVQVIFDDLRHELYNGVEAPDLRDLHAVTLNCRKCDHAKPEPQLPKWNVVDPDCVFIAETPFYDSEHSKFFVDCLVKSGFSSQRVTLTYLNRCPAKAPYTIEHVNNCAQYLYAELAILKPKLIVPLGYNATAIFGPTERLRDIRGTVMWLGPWAIAPTYAPAYALKSGDHMVEAFKSDLSSAYTFCYGVK